MVRQRSSWKQTYENSQADSRRCRNPPTEEVFFVQSAGSPDAGTGLKKSSIVQKISLAEAEALRNGSHTQSQVKIVVVDSEPQVINPNGTI